MTPRLLAALIVLATIGFVIGVSIEKGDDHHEAAAASSAGEAGHSESGEEASPSGSEEEAEHSEVGEGGERSGSTEKDNEFEPLGINLESVPLIILAALGSLALAAATFLRPRWLAALAVAVLAMGAFAALDVAEVVHQSDVDETGLAILAAAVALVHAAAALVALQLARAARA